jgi:hypothetical protein
MLRSMKKFLDNLSRNSAKAIVRRLLKTKSLCVILGLPLLAAILGRRSLRRSSDGKILQFLAALDRGDQPPRPKSPSGDFINDCIASVT